MSFGWSRKPSGKLPNLLKFSNFRPFQNFHAFASVPSKNSEMWSSIKFRGKPSIVVQRNFDKEKILAVSYEARELGITRKKCTVDQAKEKARNENVELQIFRAAEYRNGRPNLGGVSNSSKMPCKVYGTWAQDRILYRLLLDIINFETKISQISPIFEKSLQSNFNICSDCWKSFHRWMVCWSDKCTVAFGCSKRQFYASWFKRQTKERFWSQLKLVSDWLTNPESGFQITLKTKLSDPTTFTEGTNRRWETSRIKKTNSQVNCIRKAIFDELGTRDYHGATGYYPSRSRHCCNVLVNLWVRMYQLGRDSRL